MKKLLILGSLFITEDHVQRLETEGFSVERFGKPDPTEDELVQKVPGYEVIIDGGIAKFTDKVFEAADKLEVLAFTGADWQAKYPGHEAARKNGVKISNSPGGNSSAVAEFSIALALLMQRNLLEVGGPGVVNNYIAQSLNLAHIGVIGAGHIGSKIIRTAATFEPTSIRYVSRTSKPTVEALGAEKADLQTVLTESDVIFIAAPGSMGLVLDEAAIKSVKENALVVHISPLNMIDFEALLPRLKAGTIRFAMDWPSPSKEFADLPPHIWYSTNTHLAYSTHSVVKICSDMATESLLNLVSGKEDDRRVL